MHVEPESPKRIPGNSLFLFLTICVIITGCYRTEESKTTSSPSQTTAADRQYILDLLMTQQHDWNSGDVASYMEGYEKTDSLRFASGGAYRFGWQATIDRYYDTYPNRDAMGQLTFSELDVDILSQDRAMAFGRWHLVRGRDYENIGGLFTLILVRAGSGWLIKYDHTSQAASAE